MLSNWKELNFVDKIHRIIDNTLLACVVFMMAVAILLAILLSSGATLESNLMELLVTVPLTVVATGAIIKFLWSAIDLIIHRFKFHR